MRNARLTKSQQIKNKHIADIKMVAAYRQSHVDIAKSWLLNIDPIERELVKGIIGKVSLLDGKARQKSRRKLNQHLPVNISFGTLKDAFEQI
jgi:hypothetical protein